MSSYRTKTFNPDTKEYEQADWLDDYFGNHQYGVIFDSDKGKAFTLEEIDRAEKEYLKLK